MQVFIKILKIILGTILGLAFSFLIIVGLDSVLDDPPIGIGKEHDLWFIGIIVSICTFFFLWLMMQWKTRAKKIHTQGIELLPESISELIDGIIDAMKYRRSMRAEVRQELTDHFSDAMADCEDEQKKQQWVKELIEEFGDVKLLGALLRRAKKRCRPLWRTMVARTFQFVGICFLLLILYIGWFFTGKPKITTNYLEIMNQLVRPVADESQNAWPFYKEAAEKSVKLDDQKFDYSPRNPQALSEEDRRVIYQAISDNQESLELIRQGNQKPYYWMIHDTDENENPELLSILMPHLGSYRDLVRLMCWQGFLEAERGDVKKGIDDLLGAYLFGQHLRGQNLVLIESLVAISIETMATNTLRMILSEHDEQIDVEFLDSARRQFATMIDNKDFTIDFEGEKLFMYDEAQRCFTHSLFGKNHLYPQRISQLMPMVNFDEVKFFSGWFQVLFTHPDKEQTLREIEQWYSEMQKIAAMTPASANAKGLDMHVFTEEEISKNIFLNILMPSLARVNQIAWRNRTETLATSTILAVLQYQKEHGRLPESLDVLIDNGLLKVMPIDPFSDKPLIYKKTDEGFTLYSVGLNFTDDGGVPAEYESEKRNKNPQARKWGNNGDAVFWPVDKVE